jgi:predicted transposase YbfD/YdcC
VVKRARAKPQRAAGHVAIDGKRLRGSATAQSAGVHLLAAFSASLQGVIGQLAVAPDCNEITGALQLPKTLPLDGVIITGDANFTQRDICRVIIDGGGDLMTPPHLSDRPENVCEERLLVQHAGETLHQRTQPGFRHRGDQIVEHAALAEQRVDAALDGVGFYLDFTWASPRQKNSSNHVGDVPASSSMNGAVRSCARVSSR